MYEDLALNLFIVCYFCEFIEFCYFYHNFNPACLTL